MKRIIGLLVISIISIYTFSQTVSQKGITYKYNGTNPRTPLGNVYLKAEKSPNGILSDSVNGTFILRLEKLQMGSPIGNVKAIKKGMMIFNQQAVDEWSVRKEPLHLILCDADEFERQKQNLIAIGQREAKKRYEKKIAEIESNYKKESAEWYHKLSEADEELQNIRKHIGEYADIFARIDQSEIDSIAQQAMCLFNLGEVDAAIKKFEEGRYVEKLKSARRAQVQGMSIISAIQENVNKAKKDEKEYIQSIKAQIKAYKVAGAWDKVKSMMKELADELNTYSEFLDYANFCNDQKLYEESDSYYQRAFNILEETYQKDSPNQEYLETKASLFYSWGSLKCKMGDKEKSESYLLTSLDIRRKFAQKDFLVYGMSVANDLNALSWAAANANEPKKRDDYLIEAWNICKYFESADTVRYEAVAPIIVYNMAAYYWRNNKYLESEKMWLKALDLYKKQNQKPYIAGIYNNLGKLYSDMSQYGNSQQMFKKALHIRKELASWNRQEFGEDYAWTLCYIAKQFSITNQMDSCYYYCKQALDVRSQQPLNTVQTYEGFLSDILITLADYFYSNGLLQECENISYSCLDIFRRSIKYEPSKYTSSLIDILNKLGHIITENKQYKKSIDYLSEAIQIIESSKENKISLDSALVAQTYGNYAFVSIMLYNYKEAEQYSRLAINEDSSQHWVATNLAHALLFQKNFAEAEVIYFQHKNELREDFLNDFNIFEEAGVIPMGCEEELKRIKIFLNE